MSLNDDPILKSIVKDLVGKMKCHTVILYGSRARGVAVSETSDYDVLGVRKNGPKSRIAKKQDGFYWDVFVYPEKDLKKLGPQSLGWRGAKILYSQNDYGQKLLSRIRKELKRPFVPKPKYEIATLKSWAQKEIDRIRAGGTQGFFRRTELLYSLLDHYFEIRQKRFWGPKAGLNWLSGKDPQTYRALAMALKKPTDLKCLMAAASRVYKVKLVYI